MYQSTKPVVVDLSCRLNEAEVIKLKAENESLRRLLGANLPASWQFIPAKIISLKGTRLTLNAGAKDGVKTGMNVLFLGEDQKGILIGKISQADPYLAQVDLVSEARVRTGAGAVGKLTLQGQTLKLIEVEQKYRLNQGDLIISEGGNGWLPDLPVGRVGKIDNTATSIYQTAQVEPMADIKAVSQIFVVDLTL